MVVQDVSLPYNMHAHHTGCVAFYILPCRHGANVLTAAAAPLDGQILILAAACNTPHLPQTASSHMACCLDAALRPVPVQTLELVMMHKEAHDKHRIHCLAAGKDGFLYSGGEDKVRLLDLLLCPF